MKKNPATQSADACKLLHDPQVHQTELEIRNEELRQARADIEAGAARYAEFYDFALIGYFTLNRNGAIRQANFAGAGLLGLDRSKLAGLRFTTFVCADRRPAFDAFLTKVFESKTKQVCEVGLPTNSGKPPIFAHLEAIVDKSGQACHVAAVDVTERVRTELALRESEERWSFALEGAGDGVWDWNIQTGDALFSRRGWEMLGFIEDEIENRLENWETRIHPEDKPHVMAGLQAYFDGRTAAYANEHRVLCKDGSWKWILERGMVIHRDANGKPLRMIGTYTDITERKSQEQKIARLSRIHAVLSGINSTIVRVRDREGLFKEACRIAVEHGGFEMAWISEFDPVTLDVTPVAWAGIDASEHVGGSKSTARADMPQGQGISGRAIREKTVVVSNDLAAEPGVGSPKRAEAMRRGYRSLIGLPLFVEDVVWGTLTLYAREANFFTDDEVKLLTELAADISFALDHLQKEEKLNYLAYYDALTGLPNRTLLGDRVTQQLRAASRDKSSMALVLIDLERFQVINDTFGRNAADGLLKLVAERFRSVIFDHDSMARVHSDVFATLLPDIADAADVARIVEEKIMGCLSQPFELDGQELRVSAKAGVALFPDDGTELDALFNNTEAALRQAKASSDRYLFYAPKMNAQVAERLKLENKLQRALELEQFVLYYQPKVDLNTGRVAGLEALMRWNDPDTGLVPPLLFISLLEETSMIVEVGAWAMKQAVSQYAAWRTAGLLPPRIAVNVSQVQLRRKDFVATVQQAVTIAGNPDHGCDLEITESMIMEDIESSIGKLKAVRELGVEISIDDFGTGYSSLRYLTRLPITALKIDRAFVQDMMTKSDDAAIVSTIIALAHTLNLKVIAEGVETDEQSKFLRLLKCDEMQGYLFSKPVPAEQVPALIARGDGIVTSST